MRNFFGIGMLMALTTVAAAHAQSVDAVGQGVDPAASPAQQGAPIVRNDPNSYQPGLSQGANQPGRMAGAQIFDSQPNAGVTVRSDVSGGVQTVSSSGAITELRITQGRADVNVHHPENHSQILVDLPGGQVSLLKDGLYTFNASTNTVRVLHGEAEAFAGAKSEAKGTKVKETQELSFFGNAKLRSVNAYPAELTADLLRGGAGARGDGPGFGPYGDGFYGGYPAYAGAFGYPGFGYYPYGYGYPFGVGLGFGYYGGFGGFRGGGGFRR